MWNFLKRTPFYLICRFGSQSILMTRDVLVIKKDHKHNHLTEGCDQVENIPKILLVNKKSLGLSVFL